MQKAAETEEPKTEQTGHTTPHPSDVLDMPVDPNEPTYCVCQQVSYGEMIGCDNTEVSSVGIMRILDQVHSNGSPENSITKDKIPGGLTLRRILQKFTNFFLHPFAVPD